MIKKVIKKIFNYLFIALMFLTTMVGCTNEKSSTSQDKISSTSSLSSQETLSSSSSSSSSSQETSSSSSSSSSSTSSSQNSSNSSSSSSSSEVNTPEQIELLEIEYIIIEEHNLEITKYIGKKTNIIIPSIFEIENVQYTVTMIGEKAFSECSFLESIVIPSSVTNIGNSAFENCGLLTKVDYEGTISQWASIDFGNLSANPLSNSKAKLYINDVLQLQENIVLEGIEKIGSYAFVNCDFVKTIIIQSSVTSIVESAFYGCSSLKELTLPFLDTYLGYYFGSSSYDSNSDYVPKSLKKIIILGGTSIPDYAFSDCGSITSIVIPSSVTSIGESVFKGCSSLVELTLPFIDTYLGVYFGAPDSYLRSSSYVPYSLKKIIILGGTSIPAYAFFSLKHISSIVLPGEIEKVGSYAFSLCSSLTSIFIPSGVTAVFMGTNYFEYCNTLTIYCEAESLGLHVVGWNYDRPVYLGINENNYLEENGIIYVIVNGKAVVAGHTNEFGSSVAISSKITINGQQYDVTSIGDAAFSYCDFIRNISIPSSVTSIGEKAFYQCTSLKIYCEATSKPDGWDSNWNYFNNDDQWPVYWGIKPENIIVIQDGIQYLIIDGKAEVTGYTNELGSSVVIPSKITINGQQYDVTSIGKNAFYYCSFLESIVLPNGVTNIEEHAFYYCNSLESMVIPSSVTSIKSYIFLNCRFLTIYCEAESKPSGWDFYWNTYNLSDNCPVYWANEWSYVDGVPTPKNKAL